MTITPSTQPPGLRSLPRWAGFLGGGLVLLVVLGGGWILLAGTGPLPVDSWWQGQVSVTTGTIWFSLAVFLALVGGSLGAGVCFGLATLVLLLLKRRRDAFAVALSGITGVLISEILKRVVQRPRPPEPLFSATGFSYPSGHSMAAAAFAASILLVTLGARGMDNRLARARLTIIFVWAAAVIWVVAMMWSRTALHVHWLSDTVAGAALGLGVALLARAWCAREAMSEAPRSMKG